MTLRNKIKDDVEHLVFVVRLYNSVRVTNLKLCGISTAFQALNCKTISRGNPSNDHFVAIRFNDGRTAVFFGERSYIFLKRLSLLDFQISKILTECFLGLLLSEPLT
jgi:hypothetical protein